MCSLTNDVPIGEKEPAKLASSTSVGTGATVDPSLSQQQQRRKLLRTLPCAKCKVARPRVVIRQDAFCNECFQRNVGAKFRTVLGKLRTPVEDAGGKAKMMVAYSGGTASRVLLQLAHEYNQASRAQRFISFYICHVDESVIADDITKAKAYVESIRQIASEFPFTFVEEKLENVFLSEDMDVTSVVALPVRLQTSSIFTEELRMIHSRKTLSPAEKLKWLLDRMPNATARDDLVEYFRQVLLRHAAHRHGCSAVWTADTATRIAIRTIASLAKGRGLTLIYETGATSELDTNGVAIWRPLRDVLDKEVALYVQQRRLTMPPVSLLINPYATHGKPSIGRLSRDFIMGLERDFPATSNTVARTVGKLTPSATLDTNRLCPLCQRPADQDAAEWNRLCTVLNVDGLRAGLAGATRHLPDLTRFVDQQTTSTSLNSQSGKSPCCRRSDNSPVGHCYDGQCTEKPSEHAQPMDLLSVLCYGCFVNMRGLSARVDNYSDDEDEAVGIPLPPFTEKTARQRLQHERLRERIQDFLIEDSEDDVTS